MRLILFCVLLASCAACQSRPVRPDLRSDQEKLHARLTRDVHQLKADGVDDASEEVRLEVLATFGEATRASVVALVKGTYITPVATAEAGWTSTWYEVELEKVVVEPVENPIPCGGPEKAPVGIRRGKRWALRLYGGTVVIDGVRLTSRVSYKRKHLQPESRFLVFGKWCGEAFLPLNEHEGVFEVADDGKLQSLLSLDTPFTRAIEEMEGVEAVRPWVERLRAEGTGDK